METTKQEIDSELYELYKDFVDKVYKGDKDLGDAMKDEIRQLFVKFSTVDDNVDMINKEAERYAEFIMKLIYETRYEW